MRPALPSLTIQQLDYLVAVADAPLWSDAAEALGVSPSALSQGLGQLERRLGLTLFDRDGRRRVLRPEGREVVRYARRVVADTRDLGRWAQSTREGRTGSLRVGMIDVAAIVHFGSTLQRFRSSHPGVDLHLAVAPSAVLLEQLLAGELSLAVLVEPARHTGDVRLTPLIEEELGIYGPPESLDEPPDRWGPWVTFPANSHTRQLAAAKLREIGASFDVVAESHQPEVLRGMVALDMGWTVLPVMQAETEPNPLQRVRRDPLMTRRLVAAEPLNRMPDRSADSLLTQLIASADPSTGATGADQ